MPAQNHNNDNHTQGFRSFLRSRSGMVLIGFLAIGGAVLLFEHRAHVFTGNWPIALLLFLCIGMHLFMHGGHGHGNSSDDGDQK